LGFALEEEGFAPEEALFRGLLGGFFFCAIAGRLNASRQPLPLRDWSQALQRLRPALAQLLLDHLVQAAADAI
jgi:hypothetical protein